MKKKIAIVSFLILLFGSCYYDKADPVPVCNNVNAEWTRDVQPIILSKCATSSCHSGAVYIGDYTTYEGLKPFLDNGHFKMRVFDLNIMPPVTSTPLTGEQYMQLKCWYESGYPEN